MNDNTKIIEYTDFINRLQTMLQVGTVTDAYEYVPNGSRRGKIVNAYIETVTSNDYKEIDITDFIDEHGCFDDSFFDRFDGKSILVKDGKMLSNIDNTEIVIHIEYENGYDMTFRKTVVGTGDKAITTYCDFPLFIAYNDKDNTISTAKTTIGKTICWHNHYYLSTK